MKKKLLTSLISVCACISLCACGNSAASDSDEMKITATIFPVYDWCRNLTEGVEGIDLTYLMSQGTDLHSFQPSADDMVRIAESDLFIYVGGESDEWAEKAASQAVNPQFKETVLMDHLGSSLKEEEDFGEEHDHEHEDVEYDEHIWLSLSNAAFCVQAIAESLMEQDPDHAAQYEANLESYLKEIESLDEEFKTAVSSVNDPFMIVADRFPFRYLCDDYGISYDAAFAGCSAETEASFDTVLRLAQKLDEEGLEYVITTESNDGKIAKTVIENTAKKDQKILALDSMQSVTADQVKNGTTYLQAMKDNLSVLRQALADKE